jgi:SAM-dependent methyltransferase
VDRVGERQASYYTQTSADYENAHVSESDAHAVALRYMSAFIAAFGYSSVLDVGAGTGRAVECLSRRHPGVTVKGVEPVQALIEVAETKPSIAAGQIELGRGEALPFPDRSFDVVCEIGVLHHVRHPAPVIAEMTRVARHAIFLSDINRFGRGSLVAGGVKLLLWKLRMWGMVDRLKTRGRGYRVERIDGVSFSYSVYDSFKVLSAWADRTFLVPTVPARSRIWFHPLLSADHVLLCAIRNES